MLRRVALGAAVIGAIGSMVLTFRAGQNRSVLLGALFQVWVGAPFFALIWRNLSARRWPARVERAIQGVSVILMAASLPIYAERIPRPPGTARGAMFVMTAPASWALMAIVIGAAFYGSRRKV